MMKNNVYALIISILTKNNCSKSLNMMGIKCSEEKKREVYHITDELKQHMIESYKSGMSQGDISRETTVCQCSISKILIDAKVKKPRVKTLITIPIISKINSLYDEGYNCLSISKKLNLNTNTVNKYVYQLRKPGAKECV